MADHLFVGSFRGRAIVTALFVLLSPAGTSAQQHTQRALPNGEHVRLDNPNGHASSVLMKDGRIQSVQTDNPDDVVRLIVTFKEHAVALSHRKPSLQKSSLAAAFASLHAGHASFRTALESIRQQLSAQSKSDNSYTITHEYYRAINGVALQCKRGMIARIRVLPLVNSVSTDGEVKADLQESVHQIRADIVQDSLGYTGKGVLVGDVDTGIDYNNPALGGGFGPSYRVIGGYDFANLDNDPMDDNGHGTHVAGIIGANGGDSLRGVAPGVKFLAVKVLDANGSGYFSSVIAGIEYCLDPDNNPQTDDAVDIINMSFGGTATSDNPVDSAVANATRAGVLCVIAAGNSGQAGYGTIGSPGTSESALTVGACDSINRIAYFSSLGPDPIHSLIKPEVVAPGVRILSTVLNNKTASWSGTSMATPHVTGVAALLAQEHPLWPPEKLRAAIINSAHSAGDSVSVFAEGKGCVDALAAAEARMVVEPGVVSFGYVDLAQAVWRDTVRLTVRNFRSVAQNTQIRSIKGVPAGASLTFDATSFTLSPGEETTLQAVLTVPSTVPVVSTEPFAYEGTFDVTSDSDNVVVPFAFIKSTTLAITFDVPAFWMWLTDLTDGSMKEAFPIPDGYSKWIVPIHQGHSLDLRAQLEIDTLGVLTYYIIDHKILNPSGLTYLPVSHGEAFINMLDDSVYDSDGRRIDNDNACYSIMFVDGNSSYTSTSTYSNWVPHWARMFCSPMDSSTFVHQEMAVLKGSGVYALKKNFRGFKNQQDVRLPSGPGNLTGINFTSTYHNPIIAPKAPMDQKFFWVNFILSGIGYDRENHFGAPFSSGTFYMNRQEITNDPNMRTATYLGAGYDQWDNFPGAPEYYEDFPWLMLCTPMLTTNDNGEAVFQQFRRSDLSKEFLVEVVKQGDTVNVEDNVHIAFPNFATYLQGNTLCHIDLRSDPTGWARDGDGGTMSSTGLYEEDSFFYQYWNIPRFTLQAFARNQVQVNIKPYQPWSYNQYHSPANDYYTNAYYVFNNVRKNAGIYRILSTTYPYKLFGQSGECTVDYEYQMPDAASWPMDTRTVFPSFDLLQVSVNDRSADIVRPDQNAKLRLVLFDPDSSVGSVTLSLLLASGVEIDLPVTFAGGHEYDATIPTYVPSGFVDVVARAEDAKGNTCELTASPAFYCGTTSDTRKLDARLRMISYALNNVAAVTMQSGDTLNYTLAYTNYGSDTARNVVITFPTTPYFRPIGASSWTITSVSVNDTIHVPISLVFLGKQQATDQQTHYSPSITWTSGGTPYLRHHNVLVDFQNTVTSVPQTAGIPPMTFALYQNYPNPFNPSTTIRYDVPRESKVKLIVYDILGREVATIVDEVKKPGSYQSIWNATRFASGVYFYRLQAGENSAVKKLLLLK